MLTFAASTIPVDVTVKMNGKTKMSSPRLEGVTTIPVVAVSRAADVFNPARGATALALPEELPLLEDGVTQFYGAVGKVLCSLGPR